MIKEKIKSPCLDCKDREAGCHAKCERYADWKVAYNTKMESVKVARDMDRRDYRQELMSKAKKNKIEREKKK